MTPNCCSVVRLPYISKYVLLKRWRHHAISHATPNPTIAGTFRAPERKPHSWPRPFICGSTRPLGSPLRTYRAPIPFGPYSLCPEIDIRSMRSCDTEIGTFPAAYAASVWNKTPLSRQREPMVEIG